MRIKIKDLTVLQIAQLGTYAEEYILDGVRSKRIREPNQARQAALALIKGEPLLGGDELIMQEYMPYVQAYVTKQGIMNAAGVRILQGKS
jgi:hypothetical protein